jgi:hypothetical protein
MQKVEKSIHGLLPRASMNALLDLLAKYGLLYLLRRQFLDSQRSGRNRSEPLEDDDDDSVLAPRGFNENLECVYTTYMPHLIPRVKFVDGVGGDPIIWQQCQDNECLRYTTDWVRWCGSKRCFMHFLCKACTDKNSHTCSSCERKGCKCSCRFVQC